MGDGGNKAGGKGRSPAAFAETAQIVTPPRGTDIAPDLEARQAVADDAEIAFAATGAIPVSELDAAHGHHTARIDKIPDAVRTHQMENHETTLDLTIPADDVLQSIEVDKALTHVGRYELIRVIGQGGMGVVHEALDPDLDRKVALKVLRERVVSKEARTRLVREAQMMARLSHPNVVTVYEVGVSGTQIYIAMEYVEGITFKEWLAEGEHPWHQIVGKLCDAGLGIAAGHEQGIIHRDFKPANILVGTDGRVRVTDFGIAHNKARESDIEPAAREQRRSTGQLAMLKELVAGLDMDESLTQTGSIMGTGPFVAPELYWGDPATGASDQFAFCVTLWDSLNQELPFSGDTVLERVTNMMEGPAPAPSEAGKRVPKKLQRILLRGLDRDPLKRHGSMNELLAELMQLRAARRRLFILGGAGLASVAIVAATLLIARGAESGPVASCDAGAKKVATSWNGARQAKVQESFAAASKSQASKVFEVVERELNVYASSWASAHDSACSETRIEQVRSEEVLAVRMQCLDQRRLELGALVNLFVAADRGVVSSAAAAVYQLPSPVDCREAQVRAEGEPVALKAEIQAVRAQLAAATAHEFTGQFAAGVKLSHEAHKVAEKLKYLPLASEALLVAGRLEWRAGEIAAARNTLIRAAAAAEQANWPEVKREAWIELVWVSGYELARVEEGLAWQVLADASLRGSQTPNSRLKARLLDHTGSGPIYQEKKYEEAADYLNKALELRKREFGSNHPVIAMTHNKLSVMYASLGDFVEAKKQADTALKIFRETTGSHHPGVSFALNNLGNIYAIQGELDLAEEQYQQAVELGTRTLGADHSEVAVSLSNLGILELNRDNFVAAIVQLNKVLRIEAGRLGADHPSVVTSHENLALAHHRAGNPVEALEHCGIAFRIRANSPQSSLTVQNMSETCEELLED